MAFQINPQPLYRRLRPCIPAIEGPRGPVASLPMRFPAIPGHPTGESHQDCAAWSMDLHRMEEP